MSVPGVTRKTSHGVPRYDDGRDTFILSGVEDLVAVEPLSASTRYRPLTEGLFARIRHVRDASGDYWGVERRDGLVSTYGTRRPAAAPADWVDPAAVVDPDDATHVFAWKLTSTVDPFGNRIEYAYRRDASRDDGPHHWDQLYLDEVHYVDYGPAASPQLLVTVGFK